MLLNAVLPQRGFKRFKINFLGEFRKRVADTFGEIAQFLVRHHPPQIRTLSLDISAAVRTSQGTKTKPRSGLGNVQADCQRQQKPR